MQSAAVLVVLVLLSASCAFSSTIGPWGSIIFDQLAVTLKAPGSNLVLEPIRTNDANQTWRYEDGYIVSKVNTSWVFDVSKASLSPNTPVLVFIRAFQKNQWWTINNNSIQSQLAANYYLKVKSGSFQVVVDYSFNTNCPPAFKFVEPKVGPLTCASYGDPHITCWSGTKFDFQFPGTVLLAQFNNHRIFTVQGTCGSGFPSGVTCNKGIVVQPSQGTTKIQVQWNGDVRINGVLTTVTTQLTYTYITIKKLGYANYRIDVQGGYITTYDYNFYVTVQSGTLQPSLCNCEGTLEDGHGYGLSYTLSNVSDSIYTYPPNEPFVYDPSYVPLYGPFNITAQAYDACKDLQVGPLYDNCHDIVNPQPYYEPCLEDVSAGGDPQTAQLAIAAYTVACSEKATKQNQTVVLPTAGYASTVSIPTVYNQTWDFTLSFYITSKDALSNPRTVGGDNWTVSASAGPAPIAFAVTDFGNGTYKVSYSPSAVGTYTVNVKLNGQAAGGTPVTLNIISGGNIIYNGLAVTYKGQGLNVLLEPLVSGNTKQQWLFQSGYVVSKYWNTQVLDAKDGSTKAGNSVITYTKKTSGFTNQQYEITSVPPGVHCLLATGYYLRTNGTIVYLDYTTPIQDFWYI